MIRVFDGPIAEVAADALVRTVRSDLAPVSAVSRDVGTVAGAAVEDHLLRMGSLPLGGAIITPGGDFPTDFLIHAVVMSEEEAQTSATVQKAVRNALRRASDWGLESLALPPVGMGVGLSEPEESARALVELLFNHLDEGQPPLDLTIVVTSAYEAELFGRLVRELEAERS